MASAKFPGFSETAAQFLRDLTRNNEREWFQPRKTVYENELKLPMENFVAALNAEFLKFAPDFVADPKKAVMRVYRDTRFANDKTPYKTHVAASLNKSGTVKMTLAGYYFSVSPEGVEVAAGVHQPERETLAAVRAHLLEHHAALRKIVNQKKLVDLMGPMHGNPLTRDPKGFPAEHPGMDLIRCRQWVFYRTLDGALMTTPKLFDEVLTRFRAMAPLVDFLNEPLSAKAKPRREMYFG